MSGSTSSVGPPSVVRSAMLASAPGQSVQEDLSFDAHEAPRTKAALDRAVHVRTSGIRIDRLRSMSPPGIEATTKRSSSPDHLFRGSAFVVGSLPSPRPEA